MWKTNTVVLHGLIHHTIQLLAQLKGEKLFVGLILSAKNEKKN